METTIPYGQRLANRRKAAGLGQKEFAAATGIGMRSIAGYESGERKPDLENLCKMAEFFKCPISELMP